jgi:hypothetical protein
VNALRKALRKDIWESMLRAEVNLEYWRRLGQRYYALLEYVQATVTVTTSAVFLSLFVPLHLEWIPKTLSGIAAVAAVIVSSFNWKKKIAAINRLKGLSQELINGYKELWRDIRDDKQKDDDLRKRFDRISTKISPPKGEEPNIRVDNKLIMKCEEAVYLRRGLKIS